MNTDALISIVLRWLHIIPAALAIGGVFFMRFVLPAGIAHLDAEVREQVVARCRRIFKMVIHTSILLLLLSGTINSIRMWDQYHGLHALWGIHILLGLIVFGISLWLLAGKQPPASHRGWMMANFVLLLILVAVASTLKWQREKGLKTRPSVPAAALLATSESATV